MNAEGKNRVSDSLTDAWRLRSLLGPTLFEALADIDNIGDVRSLAIELFIRTRSEPLRVGGRGYRLVFPNRHGAAEMTVNEVALYGGEGTPLAEGGDGAEHFVKNQAEIPDILRGLVIFVVAGKVLHSMDANDPPYREIIYWDTNEEKWMLGMTHFDDKIYHSQHTPCVLLAEPKK